MQTILLKARTTPVHLQQIFDTLINSFIENKVGISEHFLSDALAGNLKTHLHQLYADQAFLTAGTGNEEKLVNNQLFRSDVIYWLDRKHENIYENEFLTLIDDFVSYLNSSCYTNITGYEFHFTVYKEGAFYKRHLDQFRNNDSRQYSMIIYLNTNWMLDDGGELMIHEPDHSYTISPTSGKMVFFKSSEMEHEVLVTTKPRISITGWLKKD